MRPHPRGDMQRARSRLAGAHPLSSTSGMILVRPVVRSHHSMMRVVTCQADSGGELGPHAWDFVTPSANLECMGGSLSQQRIFPLDFLPNNGVPCHVTFWVGSLLLLPSIVSPTRVLAIWFTWWLGISS
jgi:hypothetical protein